jgi:hypothetical protein
MGDEGSTPFRVAPQNTSRPGVRIDVTAAGAWTPSTHVFEAGIRCQPEPFSRHRGPRRRLPEQEHGVASFSHPGMATCLAAISRSHVDI